MKKKLVLCFALLCFALPQNAKACWCKESTLEERYQISNAIFVGRVQEIVKDSMPGFRIVNFTVSQLIVGDSSIKEYSVFSNESEAECGIVFDKEEEYLVYAKENKKRGMLQTSFCIGTKKLHEAQAELIELEKLKYKIEK